MRLMLIRCGFLIALVGTAGAVSAADHRLADAVKQQDAVAVRALLGQRVDVNAPQPDGSTALHWAAHRDDVATADLLLRAKANVNAVTSHGVSPLALSCENGSLAMANRLLAASADPNLADAS